MSIVPIFFVLYCDLKVVSSYDCIHFDSDGISSFCCDNHVRKNGICVECEDGYIPHNGESCKPCEDDFYGRKCALHCDCNSEMRCDNVQGCIMIKDSEFVNVYSSLQKRTITTLLFQESSASSTTDIQKTSTETISTEWNTTDFQNPDPTFSFHSSVHTTMKRETATQDQSGLSDRERIIYSTGITIFVILFAFLTVALIYLYKRRSNSTKTFVEQLEPTNIAGESEDHQSIGENVYNVIDESEIYDDNILPNLCCRDNHSEFVPDTSEDECSSGYLKPIACTNLNREPHPCISSVKSRDSGYMHPYHSILPHLREKPAIYSTCETDLYLEVLPDIESESTEDAALQNIDIL